IAGEDATPMRVLAGPGTGKSFALKRRVTRLLEEGSIARRILAVTFTRNAAKSLVDELKGIGIAGCENIQAETLHAFCFRVLRKSGVFGYRDRYARPLIAVQKPGTLLFEFGPLLEDLDNKPVFGDKRNRAKLIKAYEAAWAREQRNIPGNPPSAADLQFEEAILGWLKFHRAILIGELIPLAYEYLRDNPRSDELSAFDHVLVDEYQDLNKAEQSLLDLLAEHAKFVVVGDEDQSIYRFRYANPEGVGDFSHRHSGTVDKTLTECRRCPQRIVVMANFLIRKNHVDSPGIAMQVRAENAPGEIHIVSWQSIDAEVVGVSKYSAALVASGRYKPEDIMVLCPRRLIGYRIRNEMLERGVSAHSYYFEEALEEDEAQKAFAILAMLRDPDDRVSLRFLLGCESATYLSQQYKRL